MKNEKYILALPIFNSLFTFSFSLFLDCFFLVPRHRNDGLLTHPVSIL